MAKGWSELDKKWYCFNSGGEMQTGKSYENCRLISDIIDKVRDIEHICSTLYGGYYKDNTLEINGLTLQYLRTRNSAYSGFRWDLTAGTPSDTDFINSVSNYNSDFANVSLIDPNSNTNTIDFLHLCATTNVIVDSGVVKVPSSWGGWAGDLATLTKDIHKASNDSDDFDTLNNIGKNLLCGDSSFSMPDMLADIDAVNIANIMNSTGESFSSALQEYYDSGVSKRYTLFVDHYGGPDTFKNNIDMEMNRTYVKQTVTDVLSSNASDIQKQAARNVFEEYILTQYQNE